MLEWAFPVVSIDEKVLEWIGEVSYEIECHLRVFTGLCDIMGHARSGYP
jgi:hypothetical protein